MGVDGKQKEGREEPRRSIVQRTETSWPGEEKENLQKTAQLREGEAFSRRRSLPFTLKTESRFWLRERLARLERGPQ